MAGGFARAMEFDMWWMSNVSSELRYLKTVVKNNNFLLHILYPCSTT